jgi:hypothetical protein
LERLAHDGLAVLAGALGVKNRLDALGMSGHVGQHVRYRVLSRVELVRWGDGGDRLGSGRRGRLGRLSWRFNARRGLRGGRGVDTDHAPASMAIEPVEDAVGTHETATHPAVSAGG